MFCIILLVTDLLVTDLVLYNWCLTARALPSTSYCGIINLETTLYDVYFQYHLSYRNHDSMDVLYTDHGPPNLFLRDVLIPSYSWDRCVNSVFLLSPNLSITHEFDAFMVFKLICLETASNFCL